MMAPTQEAHRMPPDSIPTLETARLRLRPMVPGDVEPLLAVFADPKVMAAFGEAPFDRVRMQRWVERNLAHQAEHGVGLFSVVHRETGLVIGDCGLELMDLAGERVAELGYDLRSDYWSQGFATEAARAVRDHAFGSLGLPRLVSLIRVGNEASRRVAEKVGMRLEAQIDRYGTAYWLYAVKNGNQEATDDRRQP
jgi:RimJ/RimL family protein N-acetyltransferase